MKTLKEKIEVMQAAERGEPIECIGLTGGLTHSSFSRWTIVQPDRITWNWGAFDYRIAPKPIEAWANVYADGNVCPHPSKEVADTLAKTGRIRCVRLREVTE